VRERWPKGAKKTLPPGERFFLRFLLMSEDDKLDRSRSVVLRVRLNSDVLRRFDVIAQGVGVASTTLAAVALGEYVRSYEYDSQLRRIAALEAARKCRVLSDGASIE